MMLGGDGELDQVDLFSQALAQLSNFSEPIDDGSNAPEQGENVKTEVEDVKPGVKNEPPAIKTEVETETYQNQIRTLPGLQSAAAKREPDVSILKVENNRTSSAFLRAPFQQPSFRPQQPHARPQLASTIRLTGSNNQRVVINASPGAGAARPRLKVPAGAASLQHGQTLMLNNQPVRVLSKTGPDGKVRYQLVSLPGGAASAMGKPGTLGPPGGINGKRSPPVVLEVEEEEEELGYTDTYADYMPLKLKLGRKHPDSVVETSSLSSVEPRDITYRTALPEGLIDEGLLSALQLESVTYCGQKHEEFLPAGERAGFFIGDGAGVGKGRTIAGLIYDNYLRGRKRALWFSTSSDLRVDAERDLNDIGAGKIKVHPLNKFKYAKISSSENNNVKKGVIFSTYSSLIGESQTSGKYSTRLKQLLNWCGPDFDGPIVFDECHKAKNLCPTGSSKPTKTGLMVLELQNGLPLARVVYASATGASEPKNMAYMTRLGLWGLGTPFKEFNNFIQAIERGGVGAMELVAMDMKLRGMYIARQLSFHGVSFKIEQVPISRDFVEIYNKSVELWCQARDKFNQACDLMDNENKLKKNMWGQFWSAHQRFFKYLCISAKVPHLVKIAREAVKNGRCVVIGLQSTGEARTLEQLEEQGGELSDFVSTAKGVFQTLLDKHFPAPDRLARGKFLELMGITGSFDSPSNSPKRKRPGESTKPAKRPRPSWMLGADDSDDNTNGVPSPKAVQSSSSESSSSSDSDDDNSDTNPFATFGSDSDEDNPWLAKKEKKQEKKKKKKKDKKEKKKKDAEESEFDALKAAGMWRKGSLPMSSLQNEVAKPPTPVARVQHEIQRPASASPTSMRTNRVPSPVFKLPEGMDAHDYVRQLKKELQELLDSFGDKLPPNSLDQLIDMLGGPENVAEMTGRKGRVVTTDEGYVQYESRSENDVAHEMLNLMEKQRFMDGDKNIAIISEAASSGISLQSDRRVLNQRRRVHITLELPWSADRAIQQFGRTHRSNQVNAPEYIFLISELAGEQRFAATVAKRLESLGALTHGDRRATETRDLSQFNIDNKYGRQALSIVMRSVLEMEPPLVPPPSDHQGDFFRDLRDALVGVGMVTGDRNSAYRTLEKDYNNISKFLNRILGMKVGLQNKLFKYFTDTLASVILQAKRDYKWDMGIMDLGSGTENVKVVRRRSFPGETKLGTSATELYTVSVERGTSWQEALDTWTEFTGRDDGFYISRDQVNKPTVILAGAMSGAKKRMYTLHKPNTGQQTRPETLEVIKKKYKRVTPDEAQVHWENHYMASAHQCSHAYWHGRCRNQSSGMNCEVGLRTRSYHILAGSVLSVWTRVETVLNQMSGHQFRMQIVRLKTDDDKRIVGCLIPPACVKFLAEALTYRPALGPAGGPLGPGGALTGRSSPMTVQNASASFRTMAAAANPYASLLKTPASATANFAKSSLHKSYSVPSSFL